MHVANAGGFQNDAHPATQCGAIGTRRFAQGLVDHGNCHVRIAHAVRRCGQAILEHQDLGPCLHGIDRGLAQALYVLGHGVIAREVEGEPHIALRPCSVDVLHHCNALSGRDPTQLGQAHLDTRAHGTQNDGHAQFAALGRVRLNTLDGRTAAEDHAGGEVLYLTLSIDGRVGHHRHGFLQVVRQRHGNG